MLQVLHPGLKLEYFHRQSWEAEWIDEAKDLVRKEFSHNYGGTASDSTATEPSASTMDFADFGNISVTTDTANELDRFLQEPVENVKEPLKWWFLNCSAYPKLSRMALDFLSVPPTSMAVERVFSQGQHLLPFTQNGLSTASIRMHLCLGSWGRSDLIQVKDIQDAIKGKKRKHTSSGAEITDAV